MAKTHRVAKSLIFAMSLIFLASCQSHGQNYSNDYHINTMERLDKNAGNEKMDRIQREIYRDK
jgi:hypothetical protein